MFRLVLLTGEEEDVGEDQELIDIDEPLRRLLESKK